MGKMFLMIQILLFTQCITAFADITCHETEVESSSWKNKTASIETDSANISIWFRPNTVDSCQKVSDYETEESKAQQWIKIKPKKDGKQGKNWLTAVLEDPDAFKQKTNIFISVCKDKMQETYKSENSGNEDDDQLNNKEKGKKRKQDDKQDDNPDDNEDDNKDDDQSKKQKGGNQAKKYRIIIGVLVVALCLSLIANSSLLTYVLSLRSRRNAAGGQGSGSTTQLATSRNPCVDEENVYEDIMPFSSRNPPVPPPFISLSHESLNSIYSACESLVLDKGKDETSSPNTGFQHKEGGYVNLTKDVAETDPESLNEEASSGLLMEHQKDLVEDGLKDTGKDLSRISTSAETLNIVEESRPDSVDKSP